MVQWGGKGGYGNDAIRKITVLRTGRKLSQGDVAERLDVSRQSVSKWETGQSVPELDKIVRLADLFGVSVDELVRDGDAPQPQPQPEAEKRIVSVRPWLSKIQIAGAVLLVLGLLNAAWGAVTSYPIWMLLSSLVVVISLPFLLCRKHPFLAAGWVAGALSLVFLNPYTSVTPLGLLGGIQLMAQIFQVPGLNTSALQFGAAIAILRGGLALILTVLTVRLALSRWRARQADRAAAPEHPAP